MTKDEDRDRRVEPSAPDGSLPDVATVSRPMPRKEYNRPQLIFYGSVADLTCGSTGKFDDFDFTFQP